MGYAFTNGTARYFHTKHLVSNLGALEFRFLMQRNTENYASHLSRIKDADNEMENALNRYTLFGRVKCDPDVEVGSLGFFTLTLPNVFR
jgi:hypothetical protein